MLAQTFLLNENISNNITFPFLVTNLVISTGLKTRFRNCVLKKKKMASFAAIFPMGTHIVQQAPLSMSTWLKHDCIGIAYPKNVIC